MECMLKTSKTCNYMNLAQKVHVNFQTNQMNMLVRIITLMSLF